MSKLILRVDDGPDIEVDTENRRAHVDIVCGKSGKPVGHCSLYVGDVNLLIYSHDRRRKAGDNRRAFIFSRHFKLEDVLAVTGSGYEYKELLRKAGFDGMEVTIKLDSACVVQGVDK